MLEVQIMADENFTTEELETEEWRDVPGYERYSVSTLGRFRATRRSKKTGVYICQPCIDDGYYRVILYSNQRPKHFGIHRLVAITFLGKPAPQQKEINHRDGNKLNNRKSNLEYCTRAENAAHASALGLLSKGTPHGNLIRAKAMRGERNWAAKLSERDVLSIRSRATGKRGEQRRFAREFKVDKSLIGLIIKRAIWTHI